MSELLSAPLSTAGAARLLVRLRWTRLRNRLLAGRSKARAGTPPGTRAGTAPKSKNGWMLALFLGGYLPFVAFQTGAVALGNMVRHESGRTFRLAQDTLPLAVIKDASIETAVLMLAALLIALAARELSAPDWDLEWLATLPVPSRTLLGLRILERAVVNPPALLLLWPFSTLVAIRAGFGVAAPFVAAVSSFLLMFTVATGWTLIDTGLRLALSPPRLRNLQAFTSLASIATLLLAMSPVNGVVRIIYEAARALPDLALWLPPALAIHAVARATALTAIRDLALLAIETSFIVAGGVALLSWALRHGFVGAGSRESTRGAAGIIIAARVPRGDGAQPWLSPIQRRELRLLSRDRNFLVQTLVLPVFMVGLQVFFGMRGLGSGKLAQLKPEHAAAVAFVIPAYAIMFSAFHAVNAEGQALWILYTLPHRLESLLRQKAALWASVSLVYPLAVLGIAFGAAGVSLRGLGLGAIAILGVPVYATIATALGVFASDPLSLETQRRLRPAYVYLYMALTGIYTFALYASGIWQRAVLMILTALVALALWQKARDQLPYLLDPAASPPARVSLADGLIAALVFFVTQALVGLALGLGASATKVTGGALIKVFVGAGAVTFAIMRFVYWRTHASGVPRLLGSRPGRAVGVGLLGAGAASAVAVAYTLLLGRLRPAPRVPDGVPGDALAWLFPLAVIAAPIFEEFIFRGLIFGGLRRTYGLRWAALASAGIFAIVHPPLSVVPVFCMGLGAALAYERTGMLLAPMVVHAGYNAVVLLYQGVLAH
jgi:ABC-2 type transport system permease protein